MLDKVRRVCKFRFCTRRREPRVQKRAPGPEQSGRQDMNGFMLLVQFVPGLAKQRKVQYCTRPYVLEILPVTVGIFEFS
jgi:hypothetical protein